MPDTRRRVNCRLPDEYRKRRKSWSPYCPRCGGVGCKECGYRERKRPVDTSEGGPDASYAERLAIGFAMLAESDDSLLDD